MIFKLTRKERMMAKDLGRGTFFPKWKCNELVKLSDDSFVFCQKTTCKSLTPTM